MAQIRTFVAVELSEAIKEQIGQVQQKLKQELGDLKWVSRNNFHLTLKFLGDVESRQIPKMAEGLTQALQEMERFSLGFAGVGGFPRTVEPRVIWIGIDEGREQLIRLQQVVDEALRVQGFPPETKRYSPHLTLARTREDSDLRQVGERLERIFVPAIGRDQVEAIRIMKSDLRPGGPVYTCLQEIRVK